MEYLICCVCSLICFVCGIWAARGIVTERQKPSEQVWTQTDDVLSRDIAAMLAYTPGREEDVHEDS